MGKAGKTAMATLVERTSRYTVPVALPAGRRDATTCDALITTVTGMPTALVKTLTFRPGQRDGRPRRVHPGHQPRCPSPTPLTLTTPHQRQHQRATPRILPPRNRDHRRPHLPQPRGR